MKKQILYMAIALPLLLGSCKDWLDVPPPTSVNEKELFEKQAGFEEAINGIYGAAAHNDLYGGVFSVELMDAMMQNYSYDNPSSDWIKTAGFDFADGMTRTRFNMIWDKAYNAVANCNLVLKNIEAKREEGIFNPGIAEIVEAEALAMRAYLHFDILRLCVPVGANGGNNAGFQAIPYVTKYSKNLTPISTAEDVMEFILEDLDRAKELLATWDPILDDAYVVNYPVASGSNITPEQNIMVGEELLPLFLQNRRHHMNYYAVCGTLARAHLWNATAYGVEESFKPAAENANEVIASDKFKWVTSDVLGFGAEVTDKYDRLMYNELIFAYYIKNETQIKAMRDRFNDVRSGYYVETATLNTVYEGQNTDLRRMAWFRQEPVEREKTKIIKYLRNSDEVGNLHYLVTPAIRLSEMHYILAECRNSGADLGELTGDAWRTLQFVLDMREVDKALDPATADFKEELLKEYRKETYSEGQAFLNYKRLQGSFQRVSPLTFYDPSTKGPGNPNGIYSPSISDSAYEWLPTTETDNRN